MSNKIFNEKISAIAEYLNDAQLRKTIETMLNNQNTAEKLRITIAGLNYAGLMDVVAGLLDIDCKLHYRNDYVLKLGFAETTQYRIFVDEKEPRVVAREVFEDHFSHISTRERAEPLTPGVSSFGELRHGEMQLKSELLTVMDMTVIFAPLLSEEDWITTLANTDYLIFVLNASALLSNDEKQFIDKVIEPIIGLARTTFLVNKMEQIPEDERQDVMDYMQGYLSMFNKNASCYFYSASVVLESRKNSLPIPDEYEKFIWFVTSDLSQRAMQVYDSATAKRMQVCMDHLTQVAERLKNQLLVDKDTVQNTLALMEKRNELIQERAKNAQVRIEIYITGLVKNELIERVGSFNAKLKEIMQRDIRSSQELKLSRKYTSSYLEYSWRKFFEAQEQWLKNRIFIELAQISKTIQEDFDAYTEGMGSKVKELMVTDMARDYGFNVFVTNKKERDSISDLTKFMNLGSAILLFVNFPWAVITFGVSQLLRVSFKESIMQEQKEAYAASVLESCDSLEVRVQKQLDKQFNDMAVELKKQINSTYDSMIRLIKNSIEMQGARLEKSGELQQYLHELEDETIPELEGLIEEVTI